LGSSPHFTAWRKAADRTRVEAVDGAGIEALVQPFPVGGVKVLGGELVEADVPEGGCEPLGHEPVASDGRGRTGRGHVVEPPL